MAIPMRTTFRVRALVFAACILSGLTAEAAREVKFKEYPLEITKGDRLVVSGVRGQVRLIPLGEPGGKSGNPVVRARKVTTDKLGESNALFESISFQTRREGSTVFVEVKGPDSRQTYITMAKPGAPELSFDIESPSTPAEIHMHSGNVVANGWKSSVAVTLSEGKVLLSEGEGDVRVLLTRGELQLSKHKGGAELELHGGKTSVSQVQGDVRLYVFSGESSVQQLTGKLRYRGKAGSLSLNKVDGDFQFENGRGGIAATALNGAVRGSTEDGAINLQLVGETDVSVETDDGSVTIKPPGGTGALLRLSSEDGLIQAPESIRVPRVTGPKSVVARLDGAPKGQIIVRAKRGVIRIR